MVMQSKYMLRQNDEMCTTIKPIQETENFSINSML